MIAVLVDCGRVEGSQAVDEAGLVDDLRGSLALSGFVGVGGFNDLWGVEKWSRRAASR